MWRVALPVCGGGLAAGEAGDHPVREHELLEARAAVRVVAAQDLDTAAVNKSVHLSCKHACDFKEEFLYDVPSPLIHIKG